MCTKSIQCPLLFQQDTGCCKKCDSVLQEPEASAEDIRADQESRDFAVAMAKVGWETKAEGMKVMHVAPLVYWCSYMVVLNIKSRPQLQAIIAKMERLAEEAYDRKISPLADTSRCVV